MNYTTIITDFINWSLQGYIDILGGFFWGVLFSTIIVYVFLTNRSAVAAAVAIIILFGAFGSSGVLIGLDAFSAFFQLLFIIIMTALIVVFLTRWRK